MWYKYKDQLYNLKTIHNIVLDKTPYPIKPVEINMYNKKGKLRFTIGFATSDQAQRELILIENILNKK